LTATGWPVEMAYAMLGGLGRFTDRVEAQELRIQRVHLNWCCLFAKQDLDDVIDRLNTEQPRTDGDAPLERHAVDTLGLRDLDGIATVVRIDVPRRQSHRGLLYAADDDGTVSFLPAHMADELLGVRRHVEHDWRTWGDARSGLTTERFADLVACFRAPVDGPPDDDEQLPAAEEVLDSGWAQVRFSQMEQWLPERVVERFGQRYDTMVDSGVLFPGEVLAEMLDALAEYGYLLEEDDRILELFRIDV